MNENELDNVNGGGIRRTVYDKYKRLSYGAKEASGITVENLDIGIGPMVSINGKPVTDSHGLFPDPLAGTITATVTGVVSGTSLPTPKK